jgi:serine/threonine protein kinase
MQRCFDVSQTTFVFILDLCNGGTLYDYLQKNGPLKENLAKQWMYQLLLYVMITLNHQIEEYALLNCFCNVMCSIHNTSRNVYALLNFFFCVA